MRFHRRDFLKSSLATAAAACGSGRRSFAKDGASINSIVDTHVYLGHWPHQSLPNDEPAALVASLRRDRVSQAWIGSFDGLFHKDVAGVNQRLAETCRRLGDGMLIPFGTINPTLPDWEEDVRRCQETFRMPGVRLHPNYHGYTLDDPRFSRLLDLAASAGLIVQLVAGMDDERRLFLSPQAAQVDLKPLAGKIAPLGKLKLVVSNGFRTTDDESIRALLPMKQVYFDFGRAENATALQTLIEKSSGDRVVFGSCGPLRPFPPNLSILRTAKLSDRDREAIASKSASQLIAMN